MDLQTVLVTGASSGIGRSAARLLSEKGYRVVLAARDSERLENVRSEIPGDSHLTAPIDLQDFDALPAWLKGIASEVGPLLGLVHCAGIQNATPLKLLDYESYRAVMDLNLGAAIALAKGFRQKKVAAPEAGMVFVSSVMGLVGQPGNTLYSASKGGVIALTRSLALELARQKIRVNCVAPGLVRTEMTEKLQQKMTPQQFAAIEAMHPLGLGEPEDVAHAICFLLDKNSKWITGSTLVVDGGYTSA